MKGYKFYLEYPNKTEKHKGTVKNPGNHSGNVLAVFNDIFWGKDGWLYEAEGAVLFTSNSPVGSTSVSPGYIEEKCKRIPERLAREIHPELFKVLDSNC